MRDGWQKRAWQGEFGQANNLGKWNANNQQSSGSPFLKEMQVERAKQTELLARVAAQQMKWERSAENLADAKYIINYILL